LLTGGSLEQLVIHNRACFQIHTKLGHFLLLGTCRHFHSWQALLRGRHVLLRAATLLDAIEHFLKFDFHDSDGVAAFRNAGLELLAAIFVVMFRASFVQLS